MSEYLGVNSVWFWRKKRNRILDESQRILEERENAEARSDAMPSTVSQIAAGNPGGLNLPSDYNRAFGGRAVEDHLIKGPRETD